MSRMTPPLKLPERLSPLNIHCWQERKSNPYTLCPEGAPTLPDMLMFWKVQPAQLMLLMNVSFASISIPAKVAIDTADVEPSCFWPNTIAVLFTSKRPPKMLKPAPQTRSPSSHPVKSTL